MKHCEQCKGTGLVQLPPQTMAVTRALWKWSLCACILDELGTLRATLGTMRHALVGAALLPPGHWTRMLLPGEASRRAGHGLIRERSISIRSDGYRVEPAAPALGPSLQVLTPTGAVMTDEATGAPLWWARIEDAERSVDRLCPLDGVLESTPAETGDAYSFWTPAPDGEEAGELQIDESVLRVYLKAWLGAKTTEFEVDYESAVALARAILRQWGDK